MKVMTMLCHTVYVCLFGVPACAVIHVKPFLGYLYLHHLLGAEDLILGLLLFGHVQLVIPIPLMFLM